MNNFYTNSAISLLYEVIISEIRAKSILYMISSSILTGTMTNVSNSSNQHVYHIPIDLDSESESTEDLKPVRKICRLNRKDKRNFMKHNKNGKRKNTLLRIQYMIENARTTRPKADLSMSSNFIIFTNNPGIYHETKPPDKQNSIIYKCISPTIYFQPICIESDINQTPSGIANLSIEIVKNHLKNSLFGALTISLYKNTDCFIYGQYRAKPHVSFVNADPKVCGPRPIFITRPIFLQAHRHLLESLLCGITQVITASFELDVRPIDFDREHFAEVQNSNNLNFINNLPQNPVELNSNQSDQSASSDTKRPKIIKKRRRISSTCYQKSELAANLINETVIDAPSLPIRTTLIAQKDNSSEASSNKQTSKQINHAPNNLENAKPRTQKAKKKRRARSVTRLPKS